MDEYDARAWIDRLIYVATHSKFTSSEREFIIQRLSELRTNLDKPIPFVENVNAR